ncbi:hypothetical protein BDW22DRAFT_415480 [Trametopsis cervina]|nr:hypothetical protein BDW22DRAFT_415480 [Trametopsis cervina]
MAPSEHQDSSVDPFLLFTPPTSTWGSHSRTDHLSSQVGVEREVIKPIIASSAASQTPSFPCTPTNIRSISSRSPVPREQSRSPSSVSASLPHDHLLQSGPSLQANSDIPAALQLSDHEAGRYSLRTRKAQQLKPYGYDKLRYKKQMRHIPEAIVKLRSPRRPRREHSLSSQHAIPSSDAEFEGDTSNTEDSDGGRRRPPQKSPQRIENNDSSHEQSDSSDHPSKKGWIPAAFDLAFSSDEDERKKKTVSRVPVTVNQQGSKRRRKRPFPMSKKQLGKLPATLDLHDVSVPGIALSCF